MTSDTGWMCDDWRSRLGWTTELLLIVLFFFSGAARGFSRSLVNRIPYSHGFVIPLMAVGRRFSRWHRLMVGVSRSHPAGLAMLGAGILLHIIGRHVHVEFADCRGFLCWVAGIIVLVNP